MSEFVKVTVARPKSEISVIVGFDEWDRLAELARALPDYCVWTAVPVAGAGHRSESTVAECGSDSPPTQNADETL